MAVLPRTAVEDPGDRLGRQGQGASVVVSVGNQREAGGETILRSSASGVENLAAARAGRGEKRNPHVEYVIEPPPCRTPQCTFPHCQDAPVCLQRGGACVRVARPNLLNLRQPEAPAGPRPTERRTELSMPETSVYEDYRCKPWKRHVVSPRQVSRVEPVAQSTGVQPATDHHLGRGIAGTDTRHVVATLFRCEDIRHDELQSMFVVGNGHEHVAVAIDDLGARLVAFPRSGNPAGHAALVKAPVEASLGITATRTRTGCSRSPAAVRS